MPGGGWPTDWFTSWPAMLIIRAGGLLDSSLHSTWCWNSLEKKRRAHCSSRIRWPPSRDANCRMFLNCRTKSIPLAASAFSFSEILVCGAQGHSGPGVQDAEAFSNNVERIAGGAPPTAWFKGIVRSSPHNGPPASGSNPVPQDSHAARVYFRCGDDHFLAFFFPEFRGNS